MIDKIEKFLIAALICSLAVTLISIYAYVNQLPFPF